MFITLIMFEVKDGQQASFEETAGKVAELARSMPGCKYFGLSVLVGEPTKYMLYEEWDSKENADSFKASSERNDGVSKLASSMASPPVTVEHQTETNDHS